MTRPTLLKRVPRRKAAVERAELAYDRLRTLQITRKLGFGLLPHPASPSYIPLARKRGDRRRAIGLRSAAAIDPHQQQNGRPRSHCGEDKERHPPNRLG